VKVLALETSCDETSAAVVEDTAVLASVTASQVAEHAPFGGVVPEVAARAHLVTLPGVIREALARAAVAPAALDAVAATAGPGLVGVSTAKARAVAWHKPYVAVNHLEGHLFAPTLQDPAFVPPAVVLLVSGGHTMLVHMRAFGDLEVLGETIDDAAGEAFDKVARLLGLGYPGGPALDRAARDGHAGRLRFPRGLAEEPYDFSFSGLKTAVANHVRRARAEGRAERTEDVCAAFQEAVVDSLVTKTFRAALDVGVPAVVLAGGVAANSALRAAAGAAALDLGLRCLLPELAYCTDNAAMIGAAAAFRLRTTGPSPLHLGVSPGCGLRALTPA